MVLLLCVTVCSCVYCGGLVVGYASPVSWGQRQSH